MALSISSVPRLVGAPRVTGIAANRRGTVLASVATLTDKRDAYRTDLYRIDGDTARRVTREPGSVGAWTLGEDGTVYFTARRPGDAPRSYLWALPPHGEARCLSTRPGGIDDVFVRGTRIVVAGGLLPSARDEADNRARDEAREDAGVSGVLRESFPTRYWDVERGPEVDAVLVGTLPEAEPPLEAPAESRDGRSEGSAAPAAVERQGSGGGEDPVAFTSLPLPAGRLDGVLVSDDGAVVLATVVGVQGTQERRSVWRLLADGPRLLQAGTATHEFSAVAISPDGTRVVIEEETAWTADSCMAVRLLTVGADGGDARPLFPEADVWLDPVWLDDRTLAATSDYRGRGAVWIASVDDASPRLLAGGAGQKWHYSSLTRAGEGLVALRSAVDAPPEPVRIDPASGEVTPLPSPVPAVPLAGALTEVEAEGEDGTPIRAWLALPEGPGPHPLVVFVHGGPWGSWNGWTWRWNPWPFVGEGYAVLLPDPAISTGYGQAMIDRGQQELGGAPFTDVLALTDAAIAREDVDAERTALAGGSYGGYMANWVAGHTGTRFRCIVSHASVWDLRTMGETTDNGTWEEALRPQLGEYSPSDFSSAIAVPMLVTHGDRDYRVPMGQSLQLWFRLQQASPHLGHTFLTFPDEGHWILRPGNARVWYETVGAFLDRHVRGRPFVRPRLLG